MPPIFVPPENPTSEEKRVLGKILFWEEQLSSNDTVACGTCHQPHHGGGDHRQAVHPGADGLFDTSDDVIGSPGIVRLDSNLQPVDDPVFGSEPQVTRRSTPSYFGGTHALDLFWDGRATSRFVDPLTQSVVISNGGALESQALNPILDTAEMSHEGRDWVDVTSKLAAVSPLALATEIPPDMAAAIIANPSYPELFEAAFGDPAISPVRIALSIATYERSLVADQTPWDLYMQGEADALTERQLEGWELFESVAACFRCHMPPLFTDNAYYNLGLRPSREDLGRQGVTGDEDDRGRFRTPSLRNAGLKESLMHVGWVDSVFDATQFYNASSEVNEHDVFFEDQSSIPTGLGFELPYSTAGLFGEGPRGNSIRESIVDFIVNGLTDPRVADEQFPFDRPLLRSETVPEPSSPHVAAVALVVVVLLRRLRRTSVARIRSVLLLVLMLVPLAADAHDEGDGSDENADLCLANGGPFGVPGLTGSPSLIGQWDLVQNWDFKAVHATLLGTGKVLGHANADSEIPGVEGTVLWEPSTPTLLEMLPGNAYPHPSSTVMTPPPDPGDLFCAGHVGLSDGRVLTVGGGGGAVINSDGRVYIFDGDTASGGDPAFPWIRRTHMLHRRWYPTVTALPDGRVMVSGGRGDLIPGEPASCCPGVPTVEIYQPVNDEWVPGPALSSGLSSYPRMFVLPDGRVTKVSYNDVAIFDPITMTWDIVIYTPANLRDDQGTGSMYRAGKVLTVGGRQLDPSDWSTNNRHQAQVLDASGPEGTWAWRSVAPMAFKRRRADNVLLPDGNVLIVGGLATSDSSPECAVHAAELWDPDTEVFTQLASQTHPRLYHSTALLLPDGRVLTMGGEDRHSPSTQFVPELFSPPYLFQGARPTIQSAPRVALYGQVIDVETPDGAALESVVLMRNGSVTHNFNMSQSYVPLSFVQNAGGLDVTMPDANLAPPGDYMLFLVNTSGVPSIASSVRMLVDRDQDGILDDGSQSLQEGDLLCDGVTTTGCDDNCPLDANPLQIDTELDGLGNACDDDDDDDGFSDAAEIAAGSDPLDAASTPTAPCPAVSHCSGHGTCVAPDVCYCDPGWSGEDCTLVVIPAPGLTTAWFAMLAGGLGLMGFLVQRRLCV